MKPNDKSHAMNVVFSGLLLLAIVLFGHWVIQPIAEPIYDKYFKLDFPEDGIWYCDELGLCLSFEMEPMSYIQISNGKTLCIHSNEPKSLRLSVYYAIKPEYTELPDYFGESVSFWDYEMGRLFMNFTLVKLDAQKMVLKGTDGTKYTFLRVEES